MRFNRTLIILLSCFIAVSASATEIVFSGEVNGQFDLFLTDKNLTNFNQITKTDANELMPAVSPDGQKLAFISDSSGANSIYLRPLAGKTEAKAADISAGMGAYANPAFSPDGKTIAVRYAPDPEDFLSHTKIVLLNPENKKQNVIIDSDRLQQSKNSEVVLSVDRPVWLSENLLAYAQIEYSDPMVGKVTKSTVFIFDIKNSKHLRVAGGESYFGADGKALGFKATMPSVIADRDGNRMLIFTAVRGNTDRTPLRYSFSGKGKGSLVVNDNEFFGPTLYNGKTWVYGIMSDNSVPGIAVKRHGIDKAREVIPFQGRALFPALIP
jgi:tricorn protease-like protein